MSKSQRSDSFSQEFARHAGLMQGSENRTNYNILQVINQNSENNTDQIQRMPSQGTSGEPRTESQDAQNRAASLEFQNPNLTSEGNQ